MTTFPAAGRAQHELLGLGKQLRAQQDRGDTSDIGIIMLRRIYRRAMEALRAGKSPKLPATDDPGVVRTDMFKGLISPAEVVLGPTNMPSSENGRGLIRNGAQSSLLEAALAAASEILTLPAAVLRRTPNISAHKQQRLYNRISAKVAQDPEVAKTLIPLHPRESEAFQSYADVLELCHEIILRVDTSKNLHLFHALIARRWMLGLPLPQIIDEQISRNLSKHVRTTIRNTLDLIEGDIRFQAVRLFGCYSTLLVYALDSAGFIDMVSSIPSLPLYLEIGASDKTMISFISLGLSRVTAMKLNGISARKDLDTAGALQWLRTRPLEALGLSPLLLAEVRAIATVPSPK